MAKNNPAAAGYIEGGLSKDLELPDCKAFFGKIDGRCGDQGRLPGEDGADVDVISISYILRAKVIGTEVINNGVGGGTVLG